MKKNISFYISKILICIIVTLIVLIYSSINSDNKRKVNDIIVNNTFDFMDFKNKYMKIFNYKEEKTNLVIKNNFEYESKEKYHDGEKYIISPNQVINPITSGIVIYIGNKDNYNNTIIIQGSDGFDIWYGNIINSNLKMYDYINEKDIVGEGSNEIYLIITKDGKYYTYEEYQEIKNK